MSYILEQDFYIQSKGNPIEDPEFASYSFGENLEKYDSFALVRNSFPMYIRVFPYRNGHQYGYDGISGNGRYAKLDTQIRNRECPKIAWGVSAYILYCHSVIFNGKVCNLKGQNQVIQINSDTNFYIDEAKTRSTYLSILWEDYKQNHSGVKFRNKTEREKQIAFIKQHTKYEKIFWKRSKPTLTKYLCTSEESIAGKLLFHSVETISLQYLKELKSQIIHLRYEWLFIVLRFIKKHIIKFLLGMFASMLLLIYQDLSSKIIDYLRKLASAIFDKLS